MKRLLTLAALCAGLTGCHSIEVTLPGGAGGKVQSFGRKSSFSELSLGTNGVLTVKGYNNDEVTGLGIAVGALERLAAKGATGGVVP